MLRFPDGMRDKIAEIAKSNGRSMNAEIIARLEQSFSNTPQKMDMFDLMEALDNESKRLGHKIVFDFSVKSVEKG